jgi:uncharacterized protein YwgA/O-acetyl-ADP-ribose deacetylase (regulator of RNase III)
MVTIIEEGDIFNSQTHTWVNTVNTVGVMGKGIALGFKRRFPDMYEDYVKRCARKEVKLGVPYLYTRPKPPWIINFPTKEHWRSVASLNAIVEGLEYLKVHLQAWGVESLAVPPLGTGEGQLEWRIVGPTLYRHLKVLTIPVELYAPFGTSHGELQPSYLEQLSLEQDLGERDVPTSRVPAAWVALVEALREIEGDRYHWPVGRIGFQKLAYFATEAGIPTGLTYGRSSYGPYASATKALLARLINNGLLTERRRGRMFNIRVGPTFPDAVVEFRQQLAQWRDAIAKVSDLMRRISTRQAEVASTVHFVARELKDRTGDIPTEVEVHDEVMRWKIRRKPGFDSQEVKEAVRNLALLGWLQVKPSPELLPEDELLGV